MTKKNTIARTATAAVACALTGALSLGAAAAPALAAEAAGDMRPLVAQSLASHDHMSEGEAVFLARQYLGVAADDVYDLDVELETYRGRLCFEVEIETWGSGAEHHVMVDAYDGAILGYWIDD